VPELTLRQLRQLARVLGVSIGQGYAAAVLDAERQAEVAPPPTPRDRAILQLLELLPEWIQESGKVPRAVGSAQARLWRLAREFLKVDEEQRVDEEAAP
jgi:hypothetical protein